jgi:hypothetical protein
MRLGLSSAAAPDATIDELLAACVRRGLAALELRQQDAHGVTGAPDGIGGAEAQERARAAGIEITGFRSETGGEDLSLARVAAAAGAPVLVGGCCVRARAHRAAGLRAVGVEVAVALEGDVPLDALERAAACGAQVAWDANVVTGGLGGTAARLLDRLGGRLRHIRILGGGPEAAMQEGRGVGELMGRLALAGYTGTVILSPSSTRYRVAWQTWVGRRAGWGCGSKEEDPSLVRLCGVPLTGAGR